MMFITLKSSERVSNMLPKFSRFLGTNSLKIANQKIDSRESIVILSIDAKLFGEVKWATSLAYDFFDTEVISISNDINKAATFSTPRLIAK